MSQQTDSAVYTAHVQARGGREGRAISDDGVLDVQLGSPAKNGQATNPEQLFAAGYAACYQSTLFAVAEHRNVDTSDSSVNASVSLHNDVNGGYMLGVKLQISLPNVDTSLAQKLIEHAHRICPYSKATRDNIEVQLELADKA